MQNLAIEIQTQNGDWQYLDLEPSTGITLKERSPLFNESILPALASYTATLPATPKNQAALQNANIIASDYRTRWSNIPARLYVSGVLWRNMVMQLQRGITAKRIPFALVAQERNTFANVSLRDIPFESFNIGATTTDIRTHMKNTILNSYPTYSHVFFRMFNQDVDGEGKDARINAWDVLAQEFLENPDGFTSDPKGLFITPFFYLFFVLQRGMELFGYSAKGDFFADSELATLAFYNNRTLDKLELVPTIDPVVTTNVFGSDITPANHLPDITIAELIVALQQMFGVAVLWRDDTAVFRLKKNIINSGSITDWTKKADPDYSISDYGGTLPRKCWYTDDTDARWQAQPDRPTVTDSDTTANLTATYLTADYEGQIFYDTDTNQYLIVRPEYDDSDPPVQIGYQFILYSEDLFCSEDIESDTKTEVGISPLLQRQGSGGGFPEVSNPLNAPLIFDQSEENEFGARLTFYRGMQDILGYGDAPFATFKSSSSVVAGVTWNYELNWNGADGLFEQFLKDWHNATKQAELVQKKIRLDITDLINFDWTKKIRIYEESVANHIYLPYEYSVTIKADCIMPAKITFAKLC